MFASLWMSFGLEIVSFCSKTGKLLGLEGRFWRLWGLREAEQEQEVGVQERACTWVQGTTSLHAALHHLSPRPLVTSRGSLLPSQSWRLPEGLCPLHQHCCSC